jgi:hypothetical protein
VNAAPGGSHAEFGGGTVGYFRFAAQEVWIILDSGVSLIDSKRADGVDKFRRELVNQASNQLSRPEDIPGHRSRCR